MIVVAHHKVKDFKSWKPFYDKDITRRKENGITDLKVGHKAEDANDVYMIWEVKNMDTIQKMIQAPDMKKMMEEAGVISTPEVSLVLQE